MMTADALQALNTLVDSLANGGHVPYEQIRDRLAAIAKEAAREADEEENEKGSAQTILILHVEQLNTHCHVYASPKGNAKRDR